MPDQLNPAILHGQNSLRDKMKKLITWDDNYSVNNDEIDNHHKKLFDIFNKLHECCLHKKTGIGFKTLLNELAAYTQYHFSAEEQFMRDIGYANIDEHMIQHEIFAAKVLKLQLDGNIDNYEQSVELIVYLGYWIRNHVLIEDKKISF